ncbi:unnamed protein product [Trichobilharzia szidati]|nr:unnamed protein product [Trichobilharzia szidati]
MSKAYFTGQFIADPPTTTLQRLKALMTGSMPTFIDAGSNFGGSKVIEDNLLKQWKLAGKQILFVGDETWIELFPDCFSHYKAYPSFNVKDLDTVDIGVENYILQALDANDSYIRQDDSITSNVQHRHLQQEQEQQQQGKHIHWDILIGHMLGIDHCGHTYGPLHPEMMRKLSELNTFISRIISKLQPNDIFLIMGDHGMTRSGDHGGDSDGELEAALLVFTGNQNTSSPSIFSSSKGISAEDDVTTMKRKKPRKQRLAQIDLVPTLSLLTGVPIPYSNLGILCEDLLRNHVNLHNGLVLNFIQMFTFTANYFYNISKLPLPSELSSHMERLVHSSTYDWIYRLTPEELLTSLKALQSIFRDHWTQFNELEISLGLLLTLASLFNLILCIEQAHVMKNPYLCSISLCLACILSFLCMNLQIPQILYFVFVILLVLSPIFFVFLQHITYNLFDAFNSSMLCFVLILLMSLSYLSNSLLIHEFHITYYFIQSFFIIRLVCVVLNSCTTEKTVINSSIVSFSQNCAAFLYRSPSALILFSILMIFRMLIWHLLICREELSLSTSTHCRSTLDPWITKSLSKLDPMNEFYPIGAVRVCFAIFVLITCLYTYWQWCLLLSDKNTPIDSSTTDCGISSSSIRKRRRGRFLLFLLIGVLLSSLWLVDSGQSVNWIKFVPTNRLHTVRVWIARILLIIISCTFCQFLKFSSSICHLYESINPMTSGYDKFMHDRTLLNAYTQWTVTCLTVLPFCVILIFINEFHVIWLAGFLIFIRLLSLLLSPVVSYTSLSSSSSSLVKHSRIAVRCQHEDEINDSSLLHVPRENISWTTAVFLCLLDNLSFYVTGHQPTLASIPWDAAYAIYEGDHSTRWLPAITVILHLYSGPIIIAFSLPVVIIISLQIKYYNHQRSNVFFSGEHKLMSGCFDYRFVDALDLLSWRFFACKFVLTLGCMLSTGILRRHLMVWKIFAPRLLFSILSLIVSTVCLLLTRYLTIHCLHNRICKILQNNL